MCGLSTMNWSTKKNSTTELSEAIVRYFMKVEGFIPPVISCLEVETLRDILCRRMQIRPGCNLEP